MPNHKTIDDYIADCEDSVKPLLEELRAFVHRTLPGSSEGMAFGAPVFFNAQKVPVIYLYGSKKHVNFGFLKYAELSDPEGILRGSGKPSKHVKIVANEPYNRSMLHDFIKQCESIKS